jgi:hypothetical protein
MGYTLELTVSEATARSQTPEEGYDLTPTSYWVEYLLAARRYQNNKIKELRTIKGDKTRP